MPNMNEEASPALAALENKIKAQIAKSVEENFDKDASYEIPLFSQFYGYPVKDGLSVRYDKDAAEFKFLLDLLDSSSLHDRPKRLSAKKRERRESVAASVDDANKQETFAIVAAMPISDELCMTRKIDIVADIYSSYDDLKRLVATCRIILAEGIEESQVPIVLDEFEQKRKDMFSANRDRISCDKSKKIEKETLASEACLEASEVMVRNKIETTY